MEMYLEFGPNPVDMIHYPFCNEAVERSTGNQKNEGVVLRPGERDVKSVLTEASTAQPNKNPG
jgi:hypothetical protein